MKKIITTALCLALSACATGYTLVSPAPVKVAKGTMTVAPSAEWNRIPKWIYDIPEEENWTANGPLLDSIGFIGGLPGGKAMVKQRKKEDRKVPVFRADMTAQDMVSMIESYYRIRGAISVFEATGVQPTTFLGHPGIRFDYDYVTADEVKRRGRSLAAIIDGKLYLMALDATRMHYFDAALPQFEAMAARAKIG